MATNQNIRTARTLLRPYVAADREKFADMFTDDDVKMYFPQGGCASREEAYQLFDKCFVVYSTNDPATRHFEIWGIEMQGELIGHFELKQTNHTVPGELEVVYLLDKTFWGRGLMPEILADIKLYAWSLGKQVIATINPENLKTVRALEKAGIEQQEWIGEGEERVYKVWLR